MNLLIEGKKAIVCGASRGVGRAIAMALVKEGVHVTLVARGREALDRTKSAILGELKTASVDVVAVDFTLESAPNLIMESCPEPDILLTSGVRLPHGSARDFPRDRWIASLDASMIGPLAIIRAVIGGMCQRRFGRIVNIMGSSLKAPIPAMALTNAGRAALAAVVSGLAREVASDNVTLNNILLGSIDTEGLAQNWSDRAQRQGTTLDAIRAEAIAKIPARRLGTPDEVAHLCLPLCHGGLGFLTAQNIVLDGGAYTGLF
jgi:3-oxoacyl-[acyl-carrier protein] reductase